MSVIATKNLSSLRLRFDCGLDDTTGKSITKSRTYSNIKAESSGDDVYQVATALSSLQKHDLLEVVRIDNSTLNA